MGERRLARLGREFDLTLEYRFVEIHPETPAVGMPVSRLGYAPDRWAAMQANLRRMGAEEGIVFNERTFTTNSRKAFLLAEAVRETAPAAFPALNEALFHAYFTELRNIGDERILREVAGAAGVPPGPVERAWSDASLELRLANHLEEASGRNLTGVPAFLLAGKWLIEGAVPLEALREAAHRLADGAG